MKMELIGHNKAPRRVYIDVEDPTKWTFSSGVGDDLIAIYETMIGGFSQLRTCGWVEITDECCSDGYDNDADGKIDAEDQGCQ